MSERSERPGSSRGHSGQLLGGRYQLTECIAVGGMGEVWKAVDDVLGREVAVKVLKPEYTGNDAFLTRFRHEARHAAALSHPNIASVYDYGESDSAAYLVMELVPGEPLNELIASEGTLPVQRAMDLLAQTARGLSAAHAAGVVHRDVKPGNLLVTPDGRVKITDFGIARAADQVPLTKTGQVMGTAQYLAPEQAMGRTATAASDVYALGVVGYEALTGEIPFTADSPVAIAMAHVNTPPPPLPLHLPPGARALISASMAKDPADRPADARVFAEAAEAVASGRDQQALAILGVGATTEALDATTVAGTPPDADDEATQLLGRTIVPAGGGAGTTAAGAPSRTPAGAGPGRPSRRMTGPLWALLALLLFVAVGAVFASGILDDDPDGSATPAPTATLPSDQPATTTTTATSRTSTPEETTSTTAAGIELNAGDYVGRDHAAVSAELRALGLRVTEQRDTDSTAEPGTVLSVNPTGALAAGDRVTLVYADGSGGDGGNGSPPTSTSTSTTTRPPTSPAPTTAPGNTGNTGNPDSGDADNGNAGNAGQGNAEAHPPAAGRSTAGSAPGAQDETKDDA
jgi:eukaryotic-like serine/threonine-protein kinase